MLRIFDCSNSDQRPATRGYGGPVENSVVTLLKKHAHKFDCVFVDTVDDSDVIFTNDVFPTELIFTDQPLIKRMDGVFWELHNMPRNLPYVEAALDADHVIFISQYSMDTYYSLIGIPLEETSFVLNWVDTDIYYPPTIDTVKATPEKFLTVATSWDQRPEKRFNAYMLFMSLIKDPAVELTLIGNIESFDIPYPDNVHLVEYIEDPMELAHYYRQADAFINLSYRDPAPKVVAEAISCGLPVLYAASGGTAELVTNNYGTRITDYLNSKYELITPSIPMTSLQFGIDYFWANYKTYRQRLLVNNFAVQQLNNMLTQYFTIFRKVVEE